MYSKIYNYCQHECMHAHHIDVVHILDIYPGYVLLKEVFCHQQPTLICPSISINYNDSDDNLATLPSIKSVTSLPIL